LPQVKHNKAEQEYTEETNTTFSNANNYCAMK